MSLTATPSGDGQVDRIDWFRMGGALSSYTYLGTGPNTVAPFVDNQEDSSDRRRRVDQLQQVQAVGATRRSGQGALQGGGHGDPPVVRIGSEPVLGTRIHRARQRPRHDALRLAGRRSDVRHGQRGASNSVEFMLPGPTFMDRPLTGLGRLPGDLLLRAATTSIRGRSTTATGTTSSRWTMATLDHRHLWLGATPERRRLQHLPIRGEHREHLPRSTSTRTIRSQRSGP